MGERHRVGRAKWVAPSRGLRSRICTSLLPGLLGLTVPLATPASTQPGPSVVHPAVTASVQRRAVAASAPVAAGLPALRVLSSVGQIRIKRMGHAIVAQAGDAISVRDNILIPAKGRLTLALDGDSRLQLLGPAQFSVEQLPAPRIPGDQGDQRLMPDIFSLDGGRLHLQWTQKNAVRTSVGSDPQGDDPKGGAPRVSDSKQGGAAGRVRPMYLYFAQRRIRLSAGEYFFLQHGHEARICVASGQAETMSITAGERYHLDASQCEWSHDKQLRVATGKAGMWAHLRGQFAASAITPDKQPGTQQLADRVKQPAARRKPVVASDAAGAPAARADAWVVNVGSYADEDAAHHQQRQLKAAGYASRVEAARVDGRTWYRVQVAGFATSAAAHAQAVALKRRLGYKRLWVTRDP